MENRMDRCDHSMLWMNPLAELPALTALMLLKGLSLALALPLLILAACRRHLVDRLYRSMAFPVF